MIRRGGLALLLVACAAAPAIARDSLGVFGGWAAFRDPDTPRCYAIATPGGGSDSGAFLSIGFWPQARVRGQLHVRLSTAIDVRRPVMLAVGEEQFQLTARGQDAWARDARADTAIIAAIRSARHVGVAATRTDGRRLAFGWSLRGAVTAIDAAALGCAGRV